MTTTKTIAERVNIIVSVQLDVDITKLKPEHHFVDDLGADSLAIVETLLAAEEEFEIDIPDEDAEDLHTVGQAIAYIEKRMAHKAATAVAL